jgi:hypothetical protein
MAYRAIVCPTCQWTTQRNGILPKLCDHCFAPMPEALLAQYNYPYQDVQQTNGQRYTGGPLQYPRSPQRNQRGFSPQHSSATPQLGRFRQWSARRQQAAGGQQQGARFSQGQATQRQQSPLRQQSQSPAPSFSPLSSGSQDSRFPPLSPQHRSQDGKPGDQSIKSQRALLATKLNKYQNMVSTLTETDDPVLFKSCQETIGGIKEQITALNTPHDRLKNLQALLTRKHKWAEHLISQASVIQSQQQQVQSEINGLQAQEKELIALISQPTSNHMDVTEDQFLQAQLAMSSMSQQLAQQQAEMAKFITQLQSVPGLPEDVLKLVPGLLPGSPAAPTPLVGLAAPCTPYRPPGIHAHSPVPPGMPTTVPSFDNEDLDDQDSYGPFSQSAFRASPYGNSVDSVEQTQVFGDTSKAAVDA